MWKVSKVTPDWHITVDTVHYSVPWRLVGTQVDVRIQGDVLTVFVDRVQQAQHQLGYRRGGYVTNADHQPAGMDDLVGLWTGDYFVHQAERIGVFTRQAIHLLLASKPIQAQTYMACSNILHLGQRAHADALERACQHLLDGDLSTDKDHHLHHSQKHHGHGQTPASRQGRPPGQDTNRPATNQINHQLRP